MIGNMKKSLFSPVLISIALGAFCVPASAATLKDVYPIPQTIKATGTQISGSALAPFDTKKFPTLVQALKSKKLRPAGTIKIVFDKDGATLKNRLKSAKKPLVLGAYWLNISSSGIKISAADPSGEFYAIQTLAQMIELDGKFGAGEVLDWPDVPFRGTVEGFYGAPWKHEARLSQIRFYGKWKMNAYIYGPKDDPYSGFGSGKWRDEYPAENAKKISELVKAANENHVNFIWALHPGSTIRWHDKDNDGIPDDVVVAMKKFEAMYKLGVRAFGVFFDDIGGEGAKAEMQVKMLNHINREFIKKKKDVAPLVMCPTQYSGTGNSPYINTLGTQLDKDISIMWTGPGICSDIPAGPTARITELIRRPPFIWWNWPVSDYCRKALLIGRTYGLAKENKGKYAGFTSNPMDKPEASKIPLFGIADYCWNIDAFNSEKSWKDSFPRLYPTLAPEMQLLANHNSDQTKGNGHGYHREESVEFLPTIEAAKKEYAAGKLSAGTQKALLDEFEKIADAGKTLIKELPKVDPALYYEIEYWVKTFAMLGHAGTSTINMINAKSPEEKLKAATRVAKSFDFLQEFYEGARKRAIFDLEQAGVGGTQWANGCEVGGRVLTPFITDTFDREWKKFYAAFAGKNAQESAKPLFATVTNIPELSKLQPTRAGGIVSLKKHEVFKIEPGQFIGIELPEGLYGTYIHLNLDNPQAGKSGIIEISKDGKTWTKLAVNGGKELQSRLDIKNEIRFFRYKNTSGKGFDIKLSQFKFDVPREAKVNSLAALTDGNPRTTYVVEKKTTLQPPRAGTKKAYVLASAPECVKTLSSGAVEVSPKKDKPVKIYEIIWK